MVAWSLALDRPDSTPASAADRFKDLFEACGAIGTSVALIPPRARTVDAGNESPAPETATPAALMENERAFPEGATEAHEEAEDAAPFSSDVASGELLEATCDSSSAWDALLMHSNPYSRSASRFDSKAASPEADAPFPI